MSDIVFISLLTSVIIAIVLPILMLGVMLIIQKIKFLQFLKGVLIGIVVNTLFLPFFFSVIMLTLQIEDVLCWQMVLSFIPYSIISFGVFYYAGMKVMRLREKSEERLSMMLGFAFVPMYSFSSMAFENLVIGDHIRIGDLEYIKQMGYEDVSLMTTIFDIDHIGYFLAVGLQAIAILCLQLIILWLICIYAQRREVKYIAICFGIIFVQQVSMYSTAFLSSWSLLLLTVCVIVLSVSAGYWLKKNCMKCMKTGEI